MSTLPEPSAPQPHLDAVNQSESQTSNAVIRPITPQDSTKTTAHYLGRRLHLALHHLGVLQHVPSGWVQVTPGGLSFASLSVREADKFVLAVEDLAQGRLAQRPTVSPDQLRLF
jgi:hypothetical protein